MGWFQDTMGFVETTPDAVRDRLVFDGSSVRSKVSGARLGTGRLELPSLAELRALDRAPARSRSQVREVVGEVGHLHRDRAHAGALFQAASQFNLLEMASPSVTPEAGLDGYSHDRTQGPACAIACGGGTIYRQYFAPVAGGLGQTADRQIDTLAELGQALGPGHWTMRNGYALCHESGLRWIGDHLAALDASGMDDLRGRLRIGVQHDVQVVGTDHTVTQVYGAALPVAYGSPPAALWEPFARLVLEAAYEATLRVARLHHHTPAFLTLLGGGVFGNEPAWIADAIVRALDRVGDLDVRIVSYGHASPVVAEIVARHRRGTAGAPRG